MIDQREPLPWKVANSLRILLYVWSLRSLRRTSEPVFHVTVAYMPISKSYLT